MELNSNFNLEKVITGSKDVSLYIRLLNGNTVLNSTLIEVVINENLSPNPNPSHIDHFRFSSFIWVEPTEIPGTVVCPTDDEVYLIPRANVPHELYSGYEIDDLSTDDVMAVAHENLEDNFAGALSMDNDEGNSVMELLDRIFIYLNERFPVA